MRAFLAYWVPNGPPSGPQRWNPALGACSAIPLYAWRSARRPSGSDPEGTHADDPQGARQRRAYKLTAEGEHALMAWLREETIPPMELRDEGLLRLAFADHLSRGEAIELVQRLRARAEQAEREFRETILPLGEALRAGGLRSRSRSAGWARATTRGRSSTSPSSKRACAQKPSQIRDRSHVVARSVRPTEKGPQLRAFALDDQVRRERRGSNFSAGRRRGCSIRRTRRRYLAEPPDAWLLDLGDERH